MPDASDIARSFLDALDHRDGSAIGALLDEDVVYDQGDGPRLVGASTVRPALIERAAALGETLGDRVVMLSEDGHRLAVEATLRGRYEKSVDGLPEATGQSYAIPACLVFELEDGRIVRFTRYVDHDRWMAALAG